VNLEQLRKQAKELTKSARSEDPAAIARLGGRKPILASAQLVIARENGYSSWPALVAASEASADAFVIAATGGRCSHARAMRKARPEIADDRWAALVLGTRWDGDPATPGGPRGWLPLVYVCHSCFASSEMARMLLDAGADPNSYFVNEYGRQSALYGAAGVRHDPELTRLLLEAGADPNDGESVYHSTAAPSTECLALLLEHGANPVGTNALGSALDDERFDHVRLLLEHGADPNEGATIAHAVRRGRGPEYVELLARYGADIDALGGERWRGNVPLRTPYQHAILRNRHDVADALTRLGARTDVADDDLAIAALARGVPPAAPLPANLDPDAQEVLILAALRGAGAVIDVLGVDFRGVIGGSPVGTILHHAAWLGNARVVDELLARGADPGARVDAGLATPLGWAALGSGQENSPEGDHVAVAEMLCERGAEIEPRFVEVAGGSLYAWLQERV
jgi:ankyrin repeat protein